MKPHAPTAWALALFASFAAHAQGSGSAAVFEGRPAMSGAQAGTGAMAGPPQGGIGVQGTDAATRPLRRDASSTESMPQGTPANAADVAAASAADQRVRDDAKALKKRDSGVAKNRETGVAKEQRGAVKKTQRAAKRSLERSRTGVGQVDTH